MGEMDREPGEGQANANGGRPTKNSRPKPSQGSRLSTSFFNLRSALTDFELWVTLTNHVNSATSFYNLAVGVAVFQRADTADNFHRIDLLRRIV